MMTDFGSWFFKTKSFPGHKGRPGLVGGSVSRTGAGVSKPGLSAKPGQAPSHMFLDDKPQLLRQSIDDAARRLIFYATETFFDTSNPYIIGRESIKHDIVTTLSQRTGLSYEGVNDVIGGWAETSNDTSDVALNLQKDFAEELGLELSDWQKQKLGELRPGQRENRWLPKADQKRLARAMYDLTQERLQRLGIEDSIILYRGAGLDTNKIWQGSGSVIDYKGNASEAWTSNYTTAQIFMNAYGDETHGATFAMRVPTKNIIGSFFSGWGCRDEVEFVIMGNLPGQEAVMVEIVVIDD